VRLLLDTHALIWWLGARRQIPKPLQAFLLDPGNDVLVSAATAWEIAIKRRIGKLEFDADFLGDFDRQVIALGFAPLAVTAAHMVAGAGIDAPHKDPFDRIIAGQALVENLVVVTADTAIAGLGAAVVWKK
jgi:PIN domain nuclease of toxin-antitoxin system